jgi:hypothetical protein
MGERELRLRDAMTLALGLMRHEDSEELADTPRELLPENLFERRERLLEVAAAFDHALALANPRERAFAEAVERLAALCEERHVPVPRAEEIGRLRERHVTPAAFHRDIQVEQLYDELLEIRRARCV